MTIDIRNATEADLDALAALNAEVQSLHAEAMPWRFKVPDSESIKAQFREWLAEENMRIVMAWVDDRAVGYADLRIRHAPEHSFCFEQRFLYIDHICVASAYRNRGVGTRLIEAAKTWARDFGISRIELDFWHFNENAGAFFSAQGFQPARHVLAMTV